MDREKEGEARTVPVKMVKSPWSVDIPNGTFGKGFCLYGRTGNMDVEWDTGHVLTMQPETFEVLSESPFWCATYAIICSAADECTDDCCYQPRGGK